MAEYEDTKMGRIMHYIDRKANFGKTLSVYDAKRAANIAYDAGMRDAVDRVSELKWGILDLNTIISDNYSIICTSPGTYRLKIDDKGWITFNSIEEAKHFASEDYKNRIKKALGL